MKRLEHLTKTWRKTDKSMGLEDYCHMRYRAIRNATEDMGDKLPVFNVWMLEEVS